MKRWLKVLLLVNFEFQGIFSGGGGGERVVYLWGLGIPSRRSQDMLQPRSHENLVLGQRIYLCGYSSHYISGRKSINIVKRSSFLVTHVSERNR